MSIARNTIVEFNITQEQRNALHELRQNDNLHISIADKTSEFVVMKKI